VRKRAASLLITVLIVSNLILVESAFAQSIPKPSVPEFSLKVVAHPYDVPPTYGIDPYTGKEITTSSGYHVENKSIEVTIKNQPFTSTLDSSGNYTNLYYNVQFKGHYGNEWSYAYSYYNASNSDYTLVSIGFEHQTISFPAGGKIDFQVRALIGHQDKMKYDTGVILPDYMRYYHVFVGQTGDWSNTQTIVIPDFSKATPNPTQSSTPDQTTEPTPSQTTEPTPSQTTEPTVNDTGQTLQLGIIIGTMLTIVLVSVGLLVYFRRRRHQTISSSLVPNNN
jgi:hypothetical protein